MKFTYDNYIPKDGETRIIEKFAWLPILIDGTGKWLETVKVKQKYTRNYVDDGWCDIQFIEE